MHIHTKRRNKKRDSKKVENQYLLYTDKSLISDKVYKVLSEIITLQLMHVYD